MAKKKKQIESPINENNITLGASWFFATIGAAVIFICATVGAGYLKTSGEIETMRAEFRKVLAKNANIEGQLQRILPLLKVSAVTEISKEPASFGFPTIETQNLDNLDVGWNFVTPSAVEALTNSMYWGGNTAELPITSNWGIVNCEKNTSLNGSLKCSPVSIEKELTQEQKEELWQSFQ